MSKIQEHRGHIDSIYSDFYAILSEQNPPCLQNDILNHRKYICSELYFLDIDDAEICEEQHVFKIICAPSCIGNMSRREMYSKIPIALSPYQMPLAITIASCYKVLIMRKMHFVNISCFEFCVDIIFPTHIPGWVLTSYRFMLLFMPNISFLYLSLHGAINRVSCPPICSLGVLPR